MTQERTGVITFAGNPLTLVGPELEVGDVLPDATLLDTGLNPVSLSSFGGKPLILVTVPSLDTSVCNIEARRFNTEAAALKGKVSVVVASMDLPFAQQRWADEAQVDALTLLSDHRDAALANALGVLVKELRLLARTVFVTDAGGKIVHAQVVPELTNEPDDDAALAAVER